MIDDVNEIVAKVFSISESQVNDESSPENIESWIPNQNLWITMSYITEDKRSIQMRADGNRFAQLLAEFRKNAFQHGST